MLKFFLDYETRSECSLKDCGGYAYAEHPTTKILCAAVLGFGDSDQPLLWVPKNVEQHDLNGKAPESDFTDAEFVSLIRNAKEIHAHNAQFERTITQHVLGWPIPLDVWHCTAALAAIMSLPRDLDRAGASMGAEQQKNREGYKVMMRWCQPKRVTRGSTEKWERDANDFRKLCDYCKQDVLAERSLHHALQPMKPTERNVWLLDQKINDRGFRVNRKAIDVMAKWVADEEELLHAELQRITCGAVNTGKQVAAMLSWLSANGVELPDLTSSTVQDALDKGGIDGKAKRVLELRQALGKSSVAKLESMKSWAGKDSRVRGSLLYYGANTGRWSGRGPQPQNYPRGSLPFDEVELAISLAEKGEDKSTIEMLWGGAAQVVSSSLRGLIEAEPGRRLLCSDYTGIEARVRSWLANDSGTLDAIRQGLDLYKVAASGIYGVAYEDVDKTQRQIGKVAELALGYQGFVGAFTKMGANYGVIIEEEEAKNICCAWRDAHPEVVTLWRSLEDAAKETVRTGHSQTVGRIAFGINKNFLGMRLPSGRVLWYYKPHLEWVTDSYERTKEALAFIGMNSMTNQWGVQYTYGGKLTENAVQAVARDIMSEAMLRLDAKGYETILTIHDEIVVEAREQTKTLDEMESIMSELPAWAECLPIEAHGWEGSRYRKG